MSQVDRGPHALTAPPGGYNLRPARALRRVPRRWPPVVARLFGQATILLTVTFAAQSIGANAPSGAADPNRAERIGLRPTQGPLSEPKPQPIVVPLQLGSRAVPADPEQSRPQPASHEATAVEPEPRLDTAGVFEAVDS